MNQLWFNLRCNVFSSIIINQSHKLRYNFIEFKGFSSIVLGACAQSTGSGQLVIGSTTYPVGPIQTGTFSLGSSGVITGVTFLIAKINGVDYKMALSI